MRPVPSTIATKLKSAAALIAERGFDQTKIEDLAEASGIPKATLYYHFAGKEEILAFLLTDLLTEITGAVGVASEAPGTGKQRLVGVVTAQLRVMASQPAVCQALVADLGRAGRIPEIAEAIADAFYTPVERVLAEGAADGSLRQVQEPAATSMAIFGAVTMTGLHYLLRGAPLDPEQLAKHLTGVLIDGLASANHG